MTCRGASIIVWFKFFIRRNLTSLSISIYRLISATIKIYRKVIFQIWFHSKVNLKYSTERGRGHEITQLRNERYHVTKMLLSVSSPQPPRHSHRTHRGPHAVANRGKPRGSRLECTLLQLTLSHWKIFLDCKLKLLNLRKRTAFTFGANYSFISNLNSEIAQLLNICTSNLSRVLSMGFLVIFSLLIKICQRNRHTIHVALK